MPMQLLMILIFLLGVIFANPSLAVEPMERGVDTAEVWAGQADQVAEAHGPEPVFSGMFVWSGRADRNYQPFFQWELRVRAGTQDLRDLRVRILPLGPDLAPLQAARTGHWQRLGSVATGAEVDASYMINTPIFPAYRVELEWSGGAASYLATDRQMLPRREGAASSVPELVVLDTMWDRNARSQAVVLFWLRNQGGVEAQGVKLTLRLRDGQGKVLLEHPYEPNGGTVPAGYAQQHRVLIDRTPPFHNVQIGVTSAEVEQMVLEAGAFSDQPVVEIAEIRAHEGRLHGKLRNGTNETLIGVEITIDLLGVEAAPGGTAQRLATLPRVQPGAVVEWSTDLDGISAWTGFETGLAYGVAGESAPDDSGAARPARPQIAVEGLVLTIDESRGAEGMLKIQGNLHNQRGTDLSGLEITIVIAGAEQDLVSHIGDLPADESFSLSLVAQGVESLSGLSMNWRSGVAAP
ncbi:MAG: hypothetical protein EA402_13090 [Planctomycetota bacterium]|nr:MAG: hypothetical protein EA402_13090 [Planctomycetota bacterium]